MTKPNLLCLHGALGCAQQLQKALAPLRENFNLYFFDFPGHGEKAGAPIDVENCVAETRNFIKQNNLASTPILGYSMGGYVALLLAKKHPEVVGKIATLGTKLNWSANIAATETKKLNPELIKEKVPHYANMLKNWHGTNWKTVLAETANLMQNLGEKPRLHTDVYQTILHPILLLLAENDTMVTVTETKHAAHMLPFGEFEKLTNSAHPIEKVAMDELASRLKYWIE